MEESARLRRDPRNWQRCGFESVVGNGYRCAVVVAVMLASRTEWTAGGMPPRSFFGRYSLWSWCHASMKTRASAGLVNQCSLRHSSRRRPLNDST